MFVWHLHHAGGAFIKIERRKREEKVEEKEEKGKKCGVNCFYIKVDKGSTKNT